MDGTLYMWCGIFQRWQLRYCVINNGQLDFYISKQSMGKREAEGIPESHHISSCEITLNKKLQTEWTIQAPGHDLVYLRVDTAEERRHWLKLIGSAKACIANTSVLIGNSRRSSNSSHVSVESVGNPQKKGGVLKTTEIDARSANSFSSSSLIVHKEPSKHGEGHNEDTNPNKSSEIGDEDTVAWTSDLNSVINDLKSEICLIQQRYCSEDDSTNTVSSLHRDSNKIFQLFKKFSQIVTCISGKPIREIRIQHQSDSECSHSDTTDDLTSQDTTDSGYTAFTSVTPQLQDGRIPTATFFSTVQVSFADVINEANENPWTDLLSSIRSETYMAACIHYTKFFDLFAGTLLAPLKSDILSNCEKVRKGFTKNPQRYVHIQLIFEDEIAKKEHLHPDSATQAVLWMMRGLRTISSFLMYACTPGHPSYQNAGSALETAYREHLKRYHNFVVQRMFTMGLKFVPSFDHFKKQIINDSNADLNSQDVNDDIMQQTLEYCKCMSVVVRSLENIYVHHKIDL